MHTSIRSISMLTIIAPLARAGVANISDTIRDGTLGWLGHVNEKTGRCSNDKMQVSGHRKIGRLKLRWSDVIRKDMKEKGVQREEAQDRGTRRMNT